MLELAFVVLFKAWLVAPTHRPRINRPWPVAVHAADLAGRPVRARVTMRLLFGGVPVGRVDNGKVYSFTGVWREKRGQEITFPPESRGQRLTFEAIVTVRGRARKLNYWVQPR